MKRAGKRMNEQQPITGPTCRLSFADKKQQLVDLGREIATDKTCRNGQRQGRAMTNIEGLALDAWIHSGPPASELEIFRQIRGMSDASFDTWKKIFNCGGTGAESPQGPSWEADDSNGTAGE